MFNPIVHLKVMKSVLQKFVPPIKGEVRMTIMMIMMMMTSRGRWSLLWRRQRSSRRMGRKTMELSHPGALL